jgi:hypothetical protein
MGAPLSNPLRRDALPRLWPPAFARDKWQLKTVTK